MQTMTAEEAIAHVEGEARKRAVHEVRVFVKVAPGEIIRQGDVYIHRVPDGHAKGAERTDRQLAIGTSRGSRHVAELPSVVYEGVTAPPGCRSTLLGPRIVSGERFVVTHPEHAHVSLPAGHYQVTHQMDARTMRRVED